MAGPKPDLTEKVGELLGPRLTNEDCGVVTDALLAASEDAHRHLPRQGPAREQKFPAFAETPSDDASCVFAEGNMCHEGPMRLNALRAAIARWQ